MNENYDDSHRRKTTRTFIYTKSKKNCETFLYSKSQALFKKVDNFRYVFIYKKEYTLRYGIFHEIFKLAFIFKKHDTLRYVTFLYTRSQTLRKKQDNLQYLFYIQKSGTLRSAIFPWIFEICGGGGRFIYLKNNALCVIFLYRKNNALCVTLLYTKSETLCVTF